VHDPDISFSLYRHAEAEAERGFGPLHHARRTNLRLVVVSVSNLFIDCCER
jgi:hypothetical protein